MFYDRRLLCNQRAESAESSSNGNDIKNENHSAKNPIVIMILVIDDDEDE